jgi:CHAT domain-containing protein
MEVFQQPTLRSRVHVEVLRPPTFPRFVEAVRRTRADGGPFFDVVHFDGHGGFGFEAGDPGRVNVFETYQGPHGKLLSETAAGGEHEVDAPELRQVLGQQRVPLLVLNACRSGMEALEDEKAQALLRAAAAGGAEEVQRLSEKLSDQSNKAILSVAGTLLDAGAHGVVGMGYAVSPVVG